MCKILFADDEQNILQYLPIVIDWKALGIQEIHTASDGESALKIVEEFKPDIAIVDVEMPGMDGLEFCRRALQILPDLKLVILSAFDRFDYAKKAISSGVKEYILKPVDEEELESIMKKILSEIEQTKNHGYNVEKITLKAIEKEMKELAESLIRGEVNTLELEKEFPFLEEYENISIVLWDKDDVVFPAKGLRAMESADQIAIPFEEGVWGFFWKRDATISMRMQVEAYDNAAKKENEHLRFFYVRKNADESIVQGLERCFHALEYAFYSHEYHIDARDIPMSFPISKIQIPDLKDALDVLSEEGDISMLEELIRNAVRNEFEHETAPATICHMVFDFFITLKIYLTKCWQEDALRIFRKMSVWSLLRCGSQEGLHALICKNLDELQMFIMKQREFHGNFYIVKIAKSYTKEHFKEPELSLQAVADAVGISRTYFSSIFKELTGEKYWDYLTRYRIEQAKNLLKNTNMSQAEISENVGYSSEFHFSRKFKEIAGISPNKYRKK